MRPQVPASIIRLRKNVRSKYRGVYYYPEAKESLSWHSVVSVDGERVSCGYFSTEHEAVKARDLAIIKLNLKTPLQLLRKI